MEINLFTSYVIYIIAAGTVFIANASVLVRYPDQKFFRYWSGSFFLWILVILSVVSLPSRMQVINTAIRQILLVYSAGLYFYAVSRIIEKRIRFVSIAFCLAVYSGAAALASPFHILDNVRVFTSNLLVSAVYLLGSIRLFGAIEPEQRNAILIKNANLITGLSSMFWGLVWLVRTVLIAASENPAGVNLYANTDANTLTGLLLSPASLFLNAAFIIQVLEKKHRITRNIRSKTLLSLNDIYKYRLIAELNAYANERIREAIEDLEKLDFNTEIRIQNFQMTLVRAEFDDCLSVIQNRNSMLMMDIETLSVIEVSDFLNNLNNILMIRFKPPVQYKTANTAQYIRVPVRYLFWILYISAGIVNESRANAAENAVLISASITETQDKKQTLVTVESSIRQEGLRDIHFTHLNIERLESLLPKSQTDSFFWLSQFVRNYFNGSFDIDIMRESAQFKAVFKFEPAI